MSKHEIAISTVAMNNGNNPRSITLTAVKSGDTGIYQEMRINAFAWDDSDSFRGRCIADVLVGITDKGEVRVFVTHDGNGDGEHAIAIYPERHSEHPSYTELLT